MRMILYWLLDKALRLDEAGDIIIEPYQQLVKIGMVSIIPMT